MTASTQPTATSRRYRSLPSVRRCVALLAVLALVAVSCGGSDPEPGGSGTDDGAGGGVSDSLGVDDGNVETTVFDFAAADAVIEEMIAGRVTRLDDLNGAALVVAHRDFGVVHRQFWGAFRDDERRVSLIASSSKMVVAMVVLALDDAGVLDIDAPIADYLPYATDHPDITTAQLLSNSSGLPGLATAVNPAYRCAYVHTSSLQECAEAVLTTPDDDADVVDPGELFDYGGSPWQIIGAVAEVTSGLSWHELVDEFLVEPCGLETFAFNNHFRQLGGLGYPRLFDGDPGVLEPTDNPNIEGGAMTHADDYIELVLAHLNGGFCGETQVLSQRALGEIFDDRIDAVRPFELRGEGGDEGEFGYGLGWWIDRDTGILADPGAYGAVPWLDLEDGYGAFLLVESSSRRVDGYADELLSAVDETFAEALG